jgi:hypothetical protein
MSAKNELTGGILVCITHKGETSFYYGENSCWLLDDWSTEVANGTYLQEMESQKVDISQWPETYLRKYLPELIIDLDRKILRSNYYDQALERRIPGDWQGIWVEDLQDFLAYLPASARLWESYI